jgi:ABC-type nickel/cobalt efflux system permease component RcnA
MLEKIALWQQKIRAHMANQMTIVSTEHTLRPLLLLMGLAFGYIIIRLSSILSLSIRKIKR